MPQKNKKSLGRGRWELKDQENHFVKSWDGGTKKEWERNQLKPKDLVPERKMSATNAKT